MALYRRRVGATTPEMPVETGLLAGREVVLAVRANETPEAVAVWLRWYRCCHGADGALIVDFAGVDALPAALDGLALELEIVLAES